jgi:hypothetical protein
MLRRDPPKNASVVGADRESAVSVLPILRADCFTAFGFDGSAR